MSEENVELVRRTMEEFNRGGPAAVLSAGFVSTEIVFDGTGARVPGVGIYQGEDEFSRFFEEDWFGTFPFEEWEIQIVEPVVDHGDQVIFKSRQQGRGRSSGAAAVLELGAVFTISNGAVVRMEVYVPPEDAFQATGLSE